MQPVATRVCPSCGTRIALEGDRCPQCGTPSSVDTPFGGTPALGTIVAGKYELLAVLGHGATGSVYRARQLALDAHVAVKVLRIGRHTPPDSLERLHAEARRASRLRHPHNVRVFDVGQGEGGLAFLAMELVEGQPLSRLAKPMAPERALKLMRQVCGAVAEAHAAGLVHRDLKPDNIMVSWVTGEEFARVLDYGIAKALAGDGPQTEPGAILGTPAYLSPEQANGGAVDARSDIYALGVVLYELVTGRLPFAGAEAIELAYQHLHQPPVPPSLLVALPSRVEPLILRCLAKRPADRPETMAELRRMIDLVLADGPEATQDLPAGVPAQAGASDTEPFTPSAALAVAETDVSASGLHRSEALAPGPLAPSTVKATGALAAPAPPARRSGPGWMAVLAVLATAAVVAVVMRGREPSPPALAEGSEGSGALAALRAVDGTGAGAGIAVNPMALEGPAEAVGSGDSAGTGAGLLVASLPEAPPEGSGARLPGVDHVETVPSPPAPHPGPPGTPPGFVRIAAGGFPMGSPPSEAGRHSDEDLYRVLLARDFYLGIHEVTQSEWRSLMGTVRTQFLMCGRDCPEDSVSWYDAVAYANAASLHEELEPCYELVGCQPALGGQLWCDDVVFRGLDCAGYRLPTEAEWEYAIRAGTTTALYSGDDDPGQHFDSPTLDPLGWYGGNSTVSYPSGTACSGNVSHPCGPHPVMHKQPNAWGLFDMAGNVEEWVWDWYGYYPTGAIVNDPLGAGFGTYRVCRGGHYLGSAHAARSAARGGLDPRVSAATVGFRLARTAGPP